MIGEEERRARLATRHHLLAADRTDDLPRLADAVVAFHSSDPVTVYLSALTRMARPAVAAVEQAIYQDRSLVRHHGMRRTLWLATPEVARLIDASSTRALLAPERRRTANLLAAAGVADPQSWLERAERAVLADLKAHGPSTAREVGQRVPEARHPLQLAPGRRYAAVQSAHTRVLLLLGFAGRVLRARPTGSWVNGAYRYAAAEDWLPGGLDAGNPSGGDPSGGDPSGGDPSGGDPSVAAAELTRRWLRAFGPGTTTDLAWWTGWTLARTRRALRDAAAVEVRVGGGPAWLAADDPGPAEPGPWVAVLPSLDPTVMGWKERGWYLPAAAAAAFDTRGNAGPTLWVDGRVVGAWAQAPDGELRTHYFERVAAPRRAELDARLQTLAEAIGDTRFTVRFPGQIQASILS